MDNAAKCSQRIKSINNKLKREIERIDRLDHDALMKRLEITTGISDMWRVFDKYQLKHLNQIWLTESINHDMSIAMCKCAKDYDISISDNIESPKQFHDLILEQMKQKRK
jgi:hypothetical protein